MFFFDIVVARIMITVVKISAIVIRIDVILITYLAFCKLSNWKLDILIILDKLFYLPHQ
jgi:hypothetical protein